MLVCFWVSTIGLESCYIFPETIAQLGLIDPSECNCALTFQEVVPHGQLISSLSFLNQLAQVHSFELARVTDLSVFKLSLEFEKNDFCLLGTFFGCDWNRLDKHLENAGAIDKFN